MKAQKQSVRYLFLSMSILSGFILVSGCTHYYYVPNAHNVPLFQEKNEARLSAAVSVGDEYQGGDFQAALAVSDHIGIMVNGFTAKGEKEYEEFHLFSTAQDHEIIRNTGKGEFLEFGPGYYLPFPNHENILFETFAGLGFGNVSSGYNSQRSHVRFQRYSLQPSFGYTGRVFDIAFSMRFALLDYTDINYSSIPDAEAEYLHNLKVNNLSLLYEPALTIRLGYQNVKLQTQLGFSENASDTDFRDNINLNFAIYIAITDKYCTNR